LLATRLGEDDRRLWKSVSLPNTHPETTPSALRRVVLGSKAPKSRRGLMAERPLWKRMGPSDGHPDERPPTIRHFVRGERATGPPREYGEWEFKVWCVLGRLETDASLAPLLSNKKGSSDLYVRLFHR